MSHALGLIALALLSLVVVHGAAAAPSTFEPPPPKTLTTLPGRVVAFAQDGNRMIWAHADAPCGRVIELKSLSSGVSRFLDARGGPLCAELTDSPAFIDSLALSGTRALWTTATETFSSVYFNVFAATSGSRREQRLGDWSVDLDDPGLAPVPMAGGGGSLYFALRGSGHEGDDLVRSGVYRVERQRVRYLPGTELSGDVDTDDRRVALTRTVPSGSDAKEPPIWSPDGTRIAFVWYAEGGKPQVVVMDPDGGNLRPLVEGQSGPYFMWAPGGKAIATYRAGSPIVVDLEGGGVRRLHAGGEGTVDVVWSPDGRRLAFSERNRVYVVSAGVGAPRALAVGRGPVWSPDSQRLAYTRLVSPDEAHVFVISASGGAEIDLGHGANPQWSHDSRYLAYYAYEPAGIPGGRDHAYIAPASGGQRVHLGIGGWGTYAWSPTSTEIAFRREDGLYLAAADRFALRRLRDGVVLDFAWSPDGAWLAFSDQDGLGAVGPGGEDTRRLRVHGDDMRWSPTSKSIAYRESGPGAALGVVDLDGAARRLGPIDLGDDGLLPLSWSPDGERLVFVTAEREIGVAETPSATSRVLTHTRPSAARTMVETRSRDGRLVSSFSAPLLVSGLAYSGGRIALVVDESPVRPEPRPGARARIEIRTSAGRLLRRVRVPRPIWGDISMSGRWVVFTSWPTAPADRGLRAVRLLDTVTGKTTVLARATLVIGLSIDGRRVAWGESDARGSRIRAVVLPRG